MFGKNYIYPFTLISITLLLVQCAQRGTLSGGPKDSFPPQLNKSASTPNRKTNFEKQDIKLVFDEYVSLNNANQQVTVSPPLKYRPKIVAVNKTVVLRFDDREVLRPYATYTIEFGQSIKDFTEGNIADNTTFLFSTGKEIDSLVVKGKAVLAETGQAAKEAIVMLYDSFEDSIARTEIPFYYGRVDDSGNFIIKNVKLGTYKVVGVIDKIPNYKIDNTSEAVGFLSSPIVVDGNNQSVINLTIFNQNPPNIITKVDSSQYGQLKITASGDIEDVKLIEVPKNLTVWTIIEKDTLTLWHNASRDNIGNIVLGIGEKRDTIQLSGVGRDSFLKKENLALATVSDKEIISFNPFKPLKMVFNAPLQEVDVSNIAFGFVDSLENKTTLPITATIAEDDKTNLAFNYQWQSDTIYEIALFPNSVTSLQGIQLKDTIHQKYRPLAQSQFGNLILKFDGIRTDTAYWVDLMFKRDNLVTSFSVKNDTVFTKKIEGLPIGEYLLNIVEDVNGNNRWDTGDYDQQRQPERMKTRTIEPVRAGWGVEVDVNLAELFDPQNVILRDTIQEKK